MSAPRFLLLAAAAVAVVPALAQAPTPSPSPRTSPAARRRGERQVVQPAAPVGPRSGTAAARMPSPGPETAGRHDGSLRGVKAVEIGEGRARLVLGGAERVVTPGSVIGTDTVKSITPGRMVLRRAAPEAEGGDAIVIVTFDAEGRTRVQVFASKDPTTRAPADVK